MNKVEFFALLRQELAGLPKEEVDERCSFYEEIINDKIDEGKTEEQAISELDSVQTIVESIANETSLVKLVKDRYKPKRRLNGWEVVLLILGFPLWFPLLITGFVLTVVFYTLTWLISIIAVTVEGALVVYGFGSIISYIASVIDGNANLMMLGMGIMGIGGAILFIFVNIAAFKLNILISKGLFLAIKKSFMRRESK